MSPRTLMRRLTPAKTAAVAALAIIAFVPAAQASTTVITLDGTPYTLTTSSSGEKANATFTGTAGQRVSLKAWGSTMHSPTLFIKKPDGTQLTVPRTVGAAGFWMEPVTLPSNGTYTVVVTPPSPYTGSINVAMWDVPADVADVIAQGGSNWISVGTPGQNGALSFSGTSGEKVSLAMTNQSLGGTYNVTLRAPDNSPVVPTVSLTSTAFIEPVTLPTTGTYKISMNPPSDNIGTVQFDLYDVPADQSGAWTVDGGDQLLTFGTPGQNGRFTFAGTAAQKVTLTATQDTVGSATITIRKPDNTVLSTQVVKSPGGGILGPVSLPTTGTYSISVDPGTSNTGSVDLSLYTSPADVSGALSSGTPMVVNLPTPGQDAVLTFAGTANQRLALDLTSSSIANATVVVTKPGGGNLYPTTNSFGTLGKFMEPVVLPLTGTYTLKINPTGVNTGSVTVGAYVISADVSITTTLGNGVTVANTMPGQNARVKFSATAGQKVSLNVTNVTGAPNAIGGVNMSLLGPTGATVLPASGFGSFGKYVEPVTIPTTGTYTAVFDMYGDTVASMTFTPYNVPADMTGALALGGAAVTDTFTIPGQNASHTFTTTTANQRVSLWITNSSIGSDWLFGTKVWVVNASGATVVPAFQFGTVDQFAGPWTFPTAGTYTLKVDPQGNRLGSVTLNAYTVPADATSTATIGGGNATVTTTAPGQNASVTFTNSAAATYTLTTDPTSACSGKIGVVANAGSPTYLPMSGFMPGDSFTFNLPASGTPATYKIVIDPDTNCTGSTLVSVS